MPKYFLIVGLLACIILATLARPQGGGMPGGISDTEIDEKIEVRKADF